MSKYSIMSCYVLIVMISSMVWLSLAINKYSFEANVGNKEYDKPFRMLKLNQLWEKALKRLDGQKLKNLMSDFKIQDKHELALKKLKTDGQDKDGIKEAQLRRTLSAILDKYGLTPLLNGSHYLDNNTGQYSSDGLNSDSLQKQIFRDKKLDKLWKKAEKSGLTDEQMKILKEEFRHHEEKIEQYYQLINDINNKENQIRAKGEDWDNSLNRILYDEVVKTSGNGLQSGDELNGAHQVLKDKHFELKDHYKKLTDKVINNKNAFKSSTNEFEEEQVNQLWKLALKSDFDKDELFSLKEELEHYQNRITKLKHFESQLESDYIEGKHINDNIDSDVTEDKHLKKKVKELTYKVNKIHNELESRIMQRHIEL